MMPAISLRAQSGQSMVEYLVVVSALLGAFLAAPDIIRQLESHMTARQEGYNYAMSLSQIPYPLATTKNIYVLEGMDAAQISALTKPQSVITQFDSLLNAPGVPLPSIPSPSSLFKTELNKYTPL
jgi:hypothetical protein